MTKELPKQRKRAVAERENHAFPGAVTRELSRQLCELCGIEAKPLGCTNDEVLDTGNMNDCEGDCIDCTWYDNDLYYPDFGQPENYIMLEEIMLKELAKECLTVVKWVHEWHKDKTLMYEYILITKTGHKFIFKHNGLKIENWFVERDDRAECLILFILWKVLPICGESLKQSIREAEWKYE